MKVNISDHAYYDRWIPYCNNMKRTKLASQVERHLFAALRQGIETDKKTGALHIEIKPYVNAVVLPNKNGGWDVVTFILKKEAREEVMV